jgi:hypoxanthine phosphoribosyltransferase
VSGIIQILDLKFQPYISAEEINKSVTDIAKKIDNEFEGKNPLFICVLSGSFIFASDLLKKVSIPCNIEFVRLKSYEGTSSSEIVREVLGLNSDIKGRDIIIIEDIVDTGHTLAHFFDYLKSYEPNSVKLASLIFKKEAFQKDFKIDYLGFEIENKFIVGYGLDYNEYGRNLDAIYQLV